MNRETLLEALVTASPALADNDLIPVLTHFWFESGCVLAYNDIIGISVPIQTDFVGAVKGKLFASLLGKYKSEAVTLNSKEGVLEVKAGNSRFKLDAFATESFPFEFPDASDGVRITAGKDALIAAISLCLQSVSSFVSVAERASVTIVPGGKKRIDLYATDSVTLSAAAVSLKSSCSLKTHATLSQAFCKAFLDIARKKDIKSFDFLLSDTHSLVTFDNGVKLLGRLIDEKLIKFSSFHIAYI